MSKITVEDAVAHLSLKWKLTDLRPFAESRLINNYLAIAYSAAYHTDVVLKILLWEDAQRYEPPTLRYFNGRGCVQTLAYDEQHHALLLLYIKPGETLRSLFPDNDEQATHVLVEVAKKLHSHPISAADALLFPTVTQWLTALDKEYEHIPDHLLAQARSRAKLLVSKTSELYLLHGDLHHENILHNNDSWIAIDPKGVVGEREYEFGAFIRNPFPDLTRRSDVGSIIGKRIELCSALSGFDAQRIADWAFVQAVMSACWTHEAGKEILMNYFLTCARIIQKLS